MTRESDTAKSNNPPRNISLHGHKVHLSIHSNQFCVMPTHPHLDTDLSSMQTNDPRRSLRVIYLVKEEFRSGTAKEASIHSSWLISGSQRQSPSLWSPLQTDKLKSWNTYNWKLFLQFTSSNTHFFHTQKNKSWPSELTPPLASPKFTFSAPSQADEMKAFYIHAIDFCKSMDIDTESKDNTKENVSNCAWCSWEKTAKP